MRPAFVTFHRWVGLILGLFCFSICFTGSILVFDTEITDFLDRKLVREQTAPLLGKLQAELLPQLPEESKITRIELFCNRVGARTKEGYKKFYYDPESLELLGEGNGLMRLVLKFHRNLLLGKPGRVVIFVSTVGLILLLFSGLRVWWPRTKKALKNALQVKTTASSIRLWLDVHRVGGFYILLPLFLIAMTGFGFSIYGREFRYAVTVLCADRTVAKPIPTKSIGPLTLEGALSIAKAHFPESEARVISLSTKKSTANILFKYPGQPGQYGRSFVKIDLASGSILEVSDARQMEIGSHFNRVWLLPLHRGRAFGLAHQILWFVVALVGASLPLTGFWLWFRKKRKKKRRDL